MFIFLCDVFFIILQNFTKIEDNDILFSIFDHNYLKSYNVVPLLSIYGELF